MNIEMYKIKLSVKLKKIFSDILKIKYTSIVNNKYGTQTKFLFTYFIIR